MDVWLKHALPKMDRNLINLTKKFGRYTGITLLLAGFSLIGSANSDPKDTDSILVFYQDSQFTKNPLVMALKQQLQLKMPKNTFQFVEISQLSKRETDQMLANASNCALSIGQLATEKMLASRKPLNYYSILVPRNILDKLNRVYARLGIFISGIYQEQPFARQIYLSKAINPEIKSVGILLEQSDKYYLEEYQSIAKKNNIELKYRLLKPADAPEKYLTQVAEENSYLLVTNNQQLFMKSKLAALVLSAYHHQIKLIGSQYEDAKIGTIASIYTSAESLAIETGNELKQLCFNGEKKTPRYANSYNVVINQQIAENMGITNLNANELSHQINQLESH